MTDSIPVEVSEEAIERIRQAVPGRPHQIDVRVLAVAKCPEAPHELHGQDARDRVPMVGITLSRREVEDKVIATKGGVRFFIDPLGRHVLKLAKRRLLVTVRPDGTIRTLAPSDKGARDPRSAARPATRPHYQFAKARHGRGARGRGQRPRRIGMR